MVVKAEPKLVTFKVNGQDITVPEGSTVLDACLSHGIEVPNLCFQPMMRPWGSCRICTVEILGRRGGLVESCAAQVREGMEVATHSPEALKSREFILQMYLIDHALDCPTCDKSGECYLQDNTYLHNVQVSPYNRPKLAQPYEHFSDVIDYKWDRCIICARCTRVCDEVIGVTAIEVDGRGLEASITPAWGMNLRDTTCISCGMCIAVCPVGAMTDRKFGAHPWELDATETICGFCDVGCTLNVEHNRGIVRRISHLWERGVNHGYTCERGKWGYQFVQNPERLEAAAIRRDGELQTVPLDEALDEAAARLSHYQGQQFAALASPENTNESNYLLQQFARAVMGSNNVDRTMTHNQAAVDRALADSFGFGASTNSVQEMFTDTGCALVVGPNIVETAPVASYWVNWARLYRETKDIVISRDHFVMCDRAQVWIKPPENGETAIINAIARVILDNKLLTPAENPPAGFQPWLDSLEDFAPEDVAKSTGVPLADIQRAAVLYATGGHEISDDPSGYGPSTIFSTLASQIGGDVYPAELALHNLALLTGNIGRAGGGVIAFRGPANFQGSTDAGCHPALLPGYQARNDADARRKFAAAWLPRWNDAVVPQNGFKRPQSLPDAPGLGCEEIIEAIADGRIKALYLAFGSQPTNYGFDARLLEVLPKLELLIVEDIYPSPLTELAHIVLPAAMFLEEDGSFTNADRTVQRVRFTLPAPGAAQPAWRLIQGIAQRLGYNLDHRHPSQIMEEMARLMPIYQGVSYPRLERGSLEWPVKSFGTEPSLYLSLGDDLAPESLKFVVS
ncbi:MAG TPA: molybdopterin-dependent oxidoreductase [Thermomicrobiaceae bacterium]|nr:molybdopterin-dependent oxidoreductase [Thermomicrobiaceae bacterium]